MKDRINEAIQMGEKNEATTQLVQNWCAHVRVGNSGGVGMVAIWTGLPIGLLHLECDYATNSGMGCWDLADSAIDFHDRNCRDCPHRKPVGFPNLSQLLAERDAAKKFADAERKKSEAESRARTDARRAKRADLRLILPPVSQTILDQIAAIDEGDHAGDAEKELIETVRLAPDALTPALTDYVFGLVEERQYWALDFAAETLPLASNDGPRLARGAMCILSRISSAAASELLQANIEHAPEDLVPDALTGLINLSRPSRDPFADLDRPRLPEGLRALHRRHPAAVEKALSRLFDEKDPWRIGEGARGVVALADADPSIALTFARDTLSKLARADWLEDRDFEMENLVHELRRGAGLAFEHDPFAVEALIKSYRQGASPEGQARLFSVYRHIVGFRFEQSKTPPTKAADLALERLIWSATEDPADEVLQEIQSVFRGGPRLLRPLAHKHVDALLGAALLLSHRLEQKGSPPAVEDPSGVVVRAMEMQSRRMTLRGLMTGFVSWASTGCQADPKATDRYLVLLKTVPETATEMRHAMIKELSGLVRGPENLSRMLSFLYAAMLGASVYERVAAVRAFADLDRLSREDAPPLLYEAFIALLADPYLSPVKAAVSALDRVRPPAELLPEIRERLWPIILTYSALNEPELVVEAAMAFARLCLKDGEAEGPLGSVLLQAIGLQDPMWFRRELLTLASRFGKNPDILPLLVKVLDDDPDLTEEALRALGLLPDALILKASKDISVAVGAWHPDDRGWHHIFSLVEVFTRLRAWGEARAIVETALTRIPDTPSMSIRRSYIHQVSHSISIEEALADADENRFFVHLADWKKTNGQIQDRRSSKRALDLAFLARAEGASQLLSARKAGGSEAAALNANADAIDRVTEVFTDVELARTYSAFAELLRVSARLLDWRRATVDGELDADRHHRAAVGRLKLWEAEDGNALGAAFAGLKETLDAVQDVTDVGPWLGTFAFKSLPVPTREGHRGIRLPKGLKTERTEEPPVELAVAFLQFRVDGEPAAEIHYLSPNEVHDLDIEVRVSRWPEGADTLKLTPVSIEPDSAYEFPTFELGRPAGDAPYVIRARGRAMLKAAQSLTARPFEFRYAARFSPLEKEQPVSVVGQRNLRIEGVDLRSGKLTGYPGLDAGILEIRDQLRSRQALGPADMESLLKLLIPLANFAGRSVQDNLIGEVWNETRVQTTLRDELRRRPDIGVALEEHPKAAGGISDLSFHGVKIELKAETARRITVSDCQAYVEQTASYVVASGLRAGILCVVDSSLKSSAPYPAEQGLAVLTPKDSPGVYIVALVIQGNLARPSDLSR